MCCTGAGYWIAPLLVFLAGLIAQQYAVAATIYSYQCAVTDNGIFFYVFSTVIMLAGAGLTGYLIGYRPIKSDSEIGHGSPNPQV